MFRPGVHREDVPSHRTHHQLRYPGYTDRIPHSHWHCGPSLNLDFSGISITFISLEPNPIEFVGDEVEHYKAMKNTTFKSGKMEALNN